MEILKEIDVPVDPSLVGDYHRLLSKGSPKKVIIKLNRRKNICRILNQICRIELKTFNPEAVNLPGETNVFSLMKVCACTTRNCGPNVKRCGLLVTFAHFGSAKDGWGSSFPMKSVSIITHDCVLKKLFPGTPVIEDN